MEKVNAKVAEKVLEMVKGKGITLKSKESKPENLVGHAFKDGQIIPNVYKIKVWNHLSTKLYRIVPANNNTDIWLEIDLNGKTIKEIERKYYGLPNRVKNL